MNRIPLERKVLSENDRIAGDLRRAFQAHGFCASTSSARRGREDFAAGADSGGFPAGTRVALLTGDIQTDNDARRLARFGFPVRQVTTAGACHLDARMVEQHLQEWDLAKLDLLLVENVGNLVCPTSYDLGEASQNRGAQRHRREDKPLKYPGIFRKSELMILNKTDLLPYVPFDLPAACEKRAQHPSGD